MEPAGIQTSDHEQSQYERCHHQAEGAAPAAAAAGTDPLLLQARVGQQPEGEQEVVLVLIKRVDALLNKR